MPQSDICTKDNDTATFSCESNGAPLSSCLWARTVNGQREVVMLGEDVGKVSTVDGVEYSVDDLNDGKCRVKVESIKRGHFGRWSCTLVEADGQVLTGAVNVRGNAL